MMLHQNLSLIKFMDWRRKNFGLPLGRGGRGVCVWGGGIPPRPSFPPERSGGGQFRSKNVRAELYNSTNIKLSDFCPTDSAARSAARYGNTGSPPPAAAAPRPGAK